MASKKKADDKKQMSLFPDFDQGSKAAVSLVYDEYKKMDRALRDIIRTNPVRPGVEDEFKLCNEIAVTIQQEIRESGMSRDILADEINAFFGRTEERHKLGECRKPLTVADIEKMMSDIKNRPIHMYYLYAFQHVLGFGLINTIAAAKGGQVVSQEDRRLMALAQIGELKARIIAAEKTLKR